MICASNATMLTPACGVGEVISGIQFAEFGEPDGCPSATNSGSCVVDARTYLQHRCVGLQKCDVPVSSEVFGTSCPSEGLVAQWSCEKALPQHLCGTWCKGAAAPCDEQYQVQLEQDGHRVRASAPCEGAWSGMLERQSGAYQLVDWIPSASFDFYTIRTSTQCAYDGTQTRCDYFQGNQGPDKATDNNKSEHKYFNNFPGLGLRVSLSESVFPTVLQLTSGPTEDRDPLTVSVYGSNDCSNNDVWQWPLQIRNVSTGFTSSRRKTYSIDLYSGGNPTITAYNCYALIVDEVRTGTAWSLAEMQLRGLKVASAGVAWDGTMLAVGQDTEFQYYSSVQWAACAHDATTTTCANFPGNESPSNAIDQQRFKYFNNDSAGVGLRVALSEPLHLSSMELTTTPGLEARDPTVVSVYAGNDCSSEEVSQYPLHLPHLDVVMPAGRVETISVDLSHAGIDAAYTCFALIVDQTKGGTSGMALAEWKLLGSRVLDDAVTEDNWYLQESCALPSEPATELDTETATELATASATLRATTPVTVASTSLPTHSSTTSPTSPPSQEPTVSVTQSATREVTEQASQVPSDEPMPTVGSTIFVISGTSSLHATAWMVLGAAVML